MSEIDDRELKQLLDALDAAEVPASGSEWHERLQERLTAESQGSRRRLKAEGRRPRRRRWVAMAAAAVVLAAAIVAATTVIGGPGSRQAAPEEATAAGVLATMERGLGETAAVSGRWTERYSSSDKRVVEYRGSFILTAAGDERLDERRVKALNLSPTERKPPQLVGTLWSYDAATHTASSVETWTDNLVYCSSGNQYRLWPEGPLFSGRVYSPFQEYRAVSAAVRAALAEKNPNVAVSAVTVEGRPAWHVVFRGRGFGGSGSRYEVNVDRQTGVLLWLRMRNTSPSGGWRDTSETRLSGITVGQSFPSRTFELKPPAGAAVREPQDYLVTPPLQGCRLEDLAGQLGIKPMLPTKIPSGFSLADVAFVKSGRMGGRGYVYTLLYRRGFDRFSVTIYQPGTSHVWMGMFGGRREQITSGAFSGQEARTFLRGPAPGPGLEVRLEKGVSLTAMVAGDLTRAQLVDVAGGLRFTGTPAQASAPAPPTAPAVWGLQAADPGGALLWGHGSTTGGTTVRSVDRSGTVVWSVGGKGANAMAGELPAGAAVVYTKVPEPRAVDGDGQIVEFDQTGQRVFVKDFKDCAVLLLCATSRRLVWVESRPKTPVALFVRQDGKVHRLAFPADGRLYNAVADDAGDRLVLQLAYKGRNPGLVQLAWIRVAPAGVPSVASRSGIGPPSIDLSPDGRWAILDNYNQRNLRIVPFGRVSGRKLPSEGMRGTLGNTRVLLTGGSSHTDLEGLTTSRYTVLILDRASLHVIRKLVFDHQTSYSPDPQMHYLVGIGRDGIVTVIDVDANRTGTLSGEYSSARPIAGGMIVTVRKSDGALEYQPNPLAQR